LGHHEKEEKYMFCPECKSEFIDGIKNCPECKVKLVEELPPVPQPPKSEIVDYEEIPATLSPSDIVILKSFLDRDEITYYIKGENYQISFAIPKLMVRTDQVEIAKELMKGLKLSFMVTN
jgi:hypothetical protein